MTQDRISALLGRPLSSVEVTNFSTYLALAQQRVSDMFCVDICQKVETRRFAVRLGYKTLNVPIFTQLSSVKLDGVVTTDYEIYQGSNLNGSWYNTLVFETPFDSSNEVVEITGDWGFSETPLDVQMLVAELFGIVTESLDGDLIQSKQVEDFRITLNHKTKTEAFTGKYAATIAKYSGCVNGNIQSGYVRHFYYV